MHTSNSYSFIPFKTPAICSLLCSDPLHQVGWKNLGSPDDRDRWHFSLIAMKSPAMNFYSRRIEATESLILALSVSCGFRLVIFYMLFSTLFCFFLKKCGQYRSIVYTVHLNTLHTLHKYSMTELIQLTYSHNWGSIHVCIRINIIWHWLCLKNKRATWTASVASRARAAFRASYLQAPCASHTHVAQLTTNFPFTHALIMPQNAARSPDALKRCLDSHHARI